MTKFFIKGVTRMYNDFLLDSWIEAEENLGLKNSMFFLDNGTTTQWVDNEEWNKFFEKVKKMNFDKVMDDYIAALDKRVIIKIFECLCIMNEVEENPKIANEDVKRRWLRLRKNTHEEIYKW